MLTLALVAVLVLALSGFASLLLPRGRPAGDWVFAALIGLGGALGLAAGTRALLSGASEELTFFPSFAGQAGFRLDPLAAAFLLPVFLIPALAALYGAAYWSDEDQPRSARRVRAFLGLLASAMATVVLARDAIVLLYAWEIMALSTFFLVVARDEDPEVRRAGWVYFVATHVGTLALLALFALLYISTGTLEIARLPAALLTPGTRAAVLVLALLGFGLKAGIVPLHVWLPGAHANAPSHVSAVLSGVLLKIGVYGVLRILWMLPWVPRWWAETLFVLGALTCLFGISLAAAQSDYKRLLAYSSIENIGVIVLALGLLSLGLADGEPALAALGLTAAILHVWNHALFKSLLFLAAGSLLHATDTRRMSGLGGLARRMPRVAVLSVLGCVALCALPPLNGFVSEWVLYSGLLRGLGAGQGAGGLAVAAVVLAMTGALALVVFVKFFGSVFLGQERSQATATAADPPRSMLVPMSVLALLCLAIGSAPTAAVGLAARASSAWSAADVAPGLAGFQGLGRIGLFSAGLLGCAVLGAFWLRTRARGARGERPPTWDCGFAAPSARMQYGEASLVQGLVGLFAWLIVPRRRSASTQGTFPLVVQRRPDELADAPDLVLDRGILPALRGAENLVLRLRLLQRGRIQIYVLYILCALFALLLVR